MVRARESERVSHPPSRNKLQPQETSPIHFGGFSQNRMDSFWREKCKRLSKRDLLMTFSRFDIRPLEELFQGHSLCTVSLATRLRSIAMTTE